MRIKSRAGVRFHATTQDAVNLFRAGGKALARVEMAGVKIDTTYLAKTQADTKKAIESKTKGLLNDKEVITPWKRRYGTKFNLQSGEQLGTVFYKDLKHPYPIKKRDENGKLVDDLTASGKWRTDEKTLSKIDHEFIRDYFSIKNLKTDLGTFLNGIAEEMTPDGYIHPNYNLHLVNTYRSSSDSPNFQNLPVRNPKRADRIRRAIISRFKNGHIVDRDFKAVEVSIAAIYHQDPTMLRYLKEGHDLHRDMASQIFMCKPEDVTKTARYCGKNMFVFPAFYGSYYIDFTKHLWEAMRSLKLDVKGIPMEEWLKKKGIMRQGRCDPNRDPQAGSFEEHMKSIEDHFWNKRFPVYTAWKKRWYNEYLKTGSIPFLTGFEVRGHLRRNAVINYAIQGVAFHCLLWSLIETQKQLRKYKMKSVVIGQIHDSLIGDVPDRELQDYLNITEEITSVKLKKHWSWINVPIGTEVEVTPASGSWADKKEWSKQGETWQLAK